MTTITRDDLARLFPRPKSATQAKIWEAYVEAITSPEGAALLSRYGITTAKRIRNFLAQFAPETGNLTLIRESGAFSETGILKTFGVGKHSAGVTPIEAKRLARNGPALFERVYGLGNPRKAHELGNTQPGDGWRFRGCGLLQITGRWAHERYAAKIGCALDDLATPINGLHAALLEWEEKGCNTYADRDDCISIRKLINAGSLKVPSERLNGVPEVRAALADARKIWIDTAPTLVADPLICKLGDRGQRVTDLQNRLSAAGFPCGPADGHYGALTERAVAAFQVAHGVKGTGIADASLWATLEAAKPVTVVRADVTASDLKAAGSETISITQRAKKTLGSIFGINAALAADDQLGLGLVDAAVSKGEQVKGLMSRSTDLVGGMPMPSARTLVAAIIALVAVLAWREWDRVERRRLADAQSGAHLGR